MGRKIAQITGVTVTSVVVLGSDFDVLLALPLGLFAGALAALLVRIAAPRQAKTPGHFHPRALERRKFASLRPHGDCVGFYSSRAEGEKSDAQSLLWCGPRVTPDQRSAHL